MDPHARTNTVVAVSGDLGHMGSTINVTCNPGMHFKDDREYRWWSTMYVCRVIYTPPLVRWLYWSTEMSRCCLQFRCCSVFRVGFPVYTGQIMIRLLSIIPIANVGCDGLSVCLLVHCDLFLLICRS